MWSGCPKARVRLWTELGGGGSSKKDNPESLEDRDNLVVAHPCRQVLSGEGVNANTNVLQSIEGTVCKNLPASAVESVN